MVFSSLRSADIAGPIARAGELEIFTSLSLNRKKQLMKLEMSRLSTRTTFEDPRSGEEEAVSLTVID